MSVSFEIFGPNYHLN